MNILRLFVIIAVIPIFFLSGCKQPEKPAVDADLLSYSADCSDQSLKADLCYQDERNNIIELTNQSLPWSVSVELTQEFTGEAYLKAQIPLSEVFVPFLSSNTGAPSGAYKLEDSNATFISSGVIIGDRVYIDPLTAEYADIIEVTSETVLSMNADLWSAGATDYNIYHYKTLTIEVTFNGEIVGEDSAYSEKLLSCNVLTMVDKVGRDR